VLLKDGSTLYATRDSRRRSIAERFLDRALYVAGGAVAALWQFFAVSKMGKGWAKNCIQSRSVA
jgi:hypothetical protein